MKKIFVRLLLLLVSMIASLLAFGCQPMSEEDSSIPWSEPAPFEDRVPGFPGS